MIIKKKSDVRLYEGSAVLCFWEITKM